MLTRNLSCHPIIYDYSDHCRQPFFHSILDGTPDSRTSILSRYFRQSERRKLQSYWCRRLSVRRCLRIYIRQRILITILQPLLTAR